MEIINYKSGDELPILDLFKKVFGSEMKLTYWKWRFENNPAGKHMIKLMWEDEKLIGHYAVSPVNMLINGTNHLSSLSMTTMTDPDHGGKGIFGKLAKELYRELEEEFNVKAIWGFPNNNSHYGFIKNLGWKDLGVVSHLCLLGERVKPAVNKKIQLFESFNNEHVQIMNRITSNFKVSVKRDADFLNWRYVYNPTSNYDKFELIDDGVQGFVVIKKYPNSQDPNIYDLYLTEIGIELSNISLLQLFISHILSYYGQKEATIYTWLSLFDKRYMHLEKLGFSIGGKPTYIGVRPNTSLSRELSDFRNWYYSYGDSDIY